MFVIRDELLHQMRLVGLIDWYVPEMRMGMAYIISSVPHRERYFKTFKFRTEDLKSQTYKPASGDAIEFVVDVDHVVGNSARQIEFYGHPNSTAVKNRLYAQDWNLKLKLIDYNKRANTQLKLVPRPRTP